MLWLGQSCIAFDSTYSGGGGRRAKLLIFICIFACKDEGEREGRGSGEREGGNCYKSLKGLAPGERKANEHKTRKGHKDKAHNQFAFSQPTHWKHKKTDGTKLLSRTSFHGVRPLTILHTLLNYPQRIHPTFFY